MGPRGRKHDEAQSEKVINWKERKIVAADLRTIYTAATAESAETALESFAEGWDARSPNISRSWRDRWELVIPFFAYPPEILKVIYTTNANTVPEEVPSGLPLFN